MGQLVNGHWHEAAIAANDNNGSFVRPDSVFRNKISADGTTDFKAEPNRYHLYISYACPWASRALIFLTLKDLHNIISYSTVDPYMGNNGWTFNDSNETIDPLFHSHYLYEIYLKADPNCTSKITVPVLWDKHKTTIVNNESSEIIRMFNSEFNEFTQRKEDYYPNALRKEIDEINALIYENVNNGVYRCGFANSQQAYEDAFDKLFDTLETVEKILAKQRYLLGERITEADWRLFTTLVRFDVVYYVHFKCNLRRIEDYPNLSNYLRDLYQMPGIKETVRFDHIKTHYYKSHTFINPTQIVPKGPAIDYGRPHNRK